MGAKVSRGLGRVERFIIDTLREHSEREGRPQARSLLALANLYATEQKQEVTRSTMESMRRSILSLEEKGFVDFGYWRLSPPAETEKGYDERFAREHLVVFQVDTDPS